MALLMACQKEPGGPPSAAAAEERLEPRIRAFVERAITFQSCPECEGTRLSPEARSAKIKGQNIAELCQMQISDLADWIRDFKEP
ncbi:MAG: hypothetical protein ACK4L7_01840, partial [Flavobacteriales bacterium]